jgi:hypothetical protein
MPAFSRLLSVLVIALLMLSRAQGCTPFVEEYPNRSYATLRANTTEFEPCFLSEEDYRKVVSAWLHARSTGLPQLTSLSLGRAVDLPWVSRAIADAALEIPNWPKKVSKSSGRRDALAAPAIRNQDLLLRLAAPFEGTNYSVTGLSFEKVLYGNADQYSSHKEAGNIKVPFDAQLWLRLAPRE